MKTTKVLLLTMIAFLATAVLPGGEAVAAAKKKQAAAKKHVVAKKIKARKHVAYRPGQRLVLIEAQEDANGNPLLRSAAVVVQDQTTGMVMFEKNSDAVLPIASITKLMTAMVTLDAGLDLRETLSIGETDIDTQRGSRSRLPVGLGLSREDMLRLALMSSDNRAAHSLSRHYPGGLPAFITAMNRKAKTLGLPETRFFDPTGLSAANVSSARDLVKLVDASSRYPLIRELSTTPEYTVTINGREQTFRNSNLLVRDSSWEISLSKTGFIKESGKCLVMQTWLNSKPVIIVLLDSWGRLTRIGDANRIKKWIENASLPQRTPGAV